MSARKLELIENIDIFVPLPVDQYIQGVCSITVDRINVDKHYNQNLNFLVKEI